MKSLLGYTWSENRPESEKACQKEQRYKLNQRVERVRDLQGCKEAWFWLAHPSKVIVFFSSPGDGPVTYLPAGHLLRWTDMAYDSWLHWEGSLAFCGGSHSHLSIAISLTRASAEWQAQRRQAISLNSWIRKRIIQVIVLSLGVFFWAFHSLVTQFFTKHTLSTN